jgi:Alpha-L-fucosidase
MLRRHRKVLGLVVGAALFLAQPALVRALDPGHASPPRSAWMPEAKWGVMTHYLFDWIAREHGLAMDTERWNALVDGFDVVGLAEQLRSIGAGYHVLTLGQNSGYYLAPNPTYDRLVGIQPSRCSRRDLVFDLSAALRQRGIRLIVYLPSGAPNADAVAREALQWQNGPHPNREFKEKWEAIVRDWSLRFGDRIDGWWFDGCYWPNTMYRTPDTPNFATLAAAARAGNPASVVAFNPGVVPRILSITPHEDYTAGEISDPSTLSIRRAADGRIDGAQLHVLSYLGRTWGLGAPRFTTDTVVGWSRDVREQGGTITWDVPVEPGGRLSPPFLDQLSAVGAALGAPARVSSSAGERLAQPAR